MTRPGVPLASATGVGAAEGLPSASDGQAVDLWVASLVPAAALSSRLAWCLAPDEEVRAQRLMSALLRDRFAVARAFLRLLLARYLGVAARDVGFRYDPHGKPGLADPGCALRFNLAHSGPLAVCAVTHGSGDIGVDVEHVKPLDDADALARAVLSPRDLVRLGALPEPVRLQSFYEAWTRKEAVLKALGCGLTRPLHSFDVSFGPGEPPRLLHSLVDPSEPGRLTLHAFEPEACCVGAVAVAGHPLRVRQLTWHWE